MKPKPSAAILASKMAVYLNSVKGSRLVVQYEQARDFLVEQYNETDVNEHEKELYTCFGILKYGEASSSFSSSSCPSSKMEAKHEKDKVKRMVEYEGDEYEEVFEDSSDLYAPGTTKAGSASVVGSKRAVAVQPLLIPSAALMEFTDSMQNISRVDAVKVVWAYAKEHSLIHEGVAHCDFKLQSLLGVQTTTRSKLRSELSPHLTALTGTDSSSTVKKRSRAANKGKDDADSEEQGTSKERKKGKRKASSANDPDKPKQAGAPNSGLNQVMKCAPLLADLLGVHKGPRVEITKACWKYFKEHNCQLESDKRIIVCDAKLLAIFGAQIVEMNAQDVAIAEKIAVDKAWADAVAEAGDSGDVVMKKKENHEDTDALIETDTSALLSAVVSTPALQKTGPDRFNMMKLSNFLSAHLSKSEDPEDQIVKEDQNLTEKQMEQLFKDVQKLSATPQYRSSMAAILAGLSPENETTSGNGNGNGDGVDSGLTQTTSSQEEAQFNDVKNIPENLFSQFHLQNIDVRKVHELRAHVKSVKETLRQEQAEKTAIKKAKESARRGLVGGTGAAKKSKEGATSTSKKINMDAMKVQPWNADVSTPSEEEGEGGHQEKKLVGNSLYDANGFEIEEEDEDGGLVHENDLVESDED